MKKILCCLIAVLSVLCASAQSSIYVGKVSEGDNLSSIPYDGYKGVCSSVSADLIRKYAGSEVVGLRVALGSAAVTNVHAFLSEDPDPNTPQNDLASMDAETVSTDWNEFLFPQPYTLTGTETELYVGYYFSCSSTEERPVLIGSTTSQYGLLVFEEGEYGTGWYDYSTTGDLAIQLILRGDNIPDYDVALENLSTDARYYAVSAEKMRMAVNLVNKGKKALSGLTLSLTFDENPELGGQLQIEEEISRTMQLPMELPMSTYNLAAGRHTLNLRVTEAKDATLNQETLDDDAANCTFYVYENAVQRTNSLLEVFPSTDSQYDELFVAPLEEFLASHPEVVPVFIHGSFDGTDPLAVDGADALAQAAGLQTAPSFGFNRTPVPGVSEYLYDYVSKPRAEDFTELLDYLNSVTPSFASIELTGKFDSASRLLTLSTKGTATKDFRTIFSYGALTIYLTEDDVNGQNHVLRKVVTATLGNVITWNVNSGLGFSRDYRLTADASWDISKMHAIAFISKMTSTATRHDNMDITNTTVLDLSTLLPDAVRDLEAQPSATSAATYDLVGRRVPTATKPGIYVREGKKVVVK